MRGVINVLHSKLMLSLESSSEKRTAIYTEGLELLYYSSMTALSLFQVNLKSSHNGLHDPLSDRLVPSKELWSQVCIRAFQKEWFSTLVEGLVKTSRFVNFSFFQCLKDSFYDIYPISFHFQMYCFPHLATNSAETGAWGRLELRVRCELFLVLKVAL